MPAGFYTIMAAQFCSALADNALLIIAIALLRGMDAPDSSEPMLKLVFAISYVVLAPLVGAFSDSKPKAKVMFLCNAIKVVGCILLILGVHPLIGYALVGLGAAAYSPAKYGILTEYLPHQLLVIANGWIEGLTVAAIVLGTVVGGFLVSPISIDWFSQHHLLSKVDPFLWALIAAGLFYLAAALFNLYIPNPKVIIHKITPKISLLFKDFFQCNKLLWQDKLGQISLAVTTLFWGAGAALQLIIIKWGEMNLNYTLGEASTLQGVFAIGIAVGAILAAKLIPLKQSMRVITLGISMGIMILIMIPIKHLFLALLILIIVGAMAGFFVVPMNALLQHRGHLLMGSGHSIAVQNFNENLSILIMMALYALLISLKLNTLQIMAIFGFSMLVSMCLIWVWYQRNRKIYNIQALIEEHADYNLEQ